MLIYETDNEYIAVEGNVTIIVNKSKCMDDYVSYIRNLMDEAINNQNDNNDAPYRLTEWSKWQLVREKRNKLLAESDWTQAPDAPLTIEQKQAWRQYRQALRDIPQRFKRADDVVWPNPPS